jgi:hypothetical protein
MDSYSKLLKLMEERGAKNNPRTVELATVVSVPPNLVIQTGDVQITNANILVADYLLNNYSRQININSNPEIIGQINFIDTLNVGDQVAVQAVSDEQIYLVLCKVVSINV